MKVKSVQKIAAVYYYVETNDEVNPNYRRSESGNWERSMGESWEAFYDEGVLEEAFQQYLAGMPKFDFEAYVKGEASTHAAPEDGVYHVDYIDDHHVRLTKNK